MPDDYDSPWKDIIAANFQDFMVMCHIGIRFPIVKLLDYAGREAELEAVDNLFATVILAHLAAQATRGDARARYEHKLRLTRRLYERGLPRQTIIDLYRFMDWLMRLPEDLELEYTDAVFQIEERLKMPYLSYVERRGERRGIARLLRDQLEQRFAPLSPEVVRRLDEADEDQLLRWGARFADARSLDELFGDAESPGSADPDGAKPDPVRH
jgi:hypothetical protein